MMATQSCNGRAKFAPKKERLHHDRQLLEWFGNTFATMSCSQLNVRGGNGRHAGPETAFGDGQLFCNVNAAYNESCERRSPDRMSSGGAGTEQADARERRIRAESQWKLNRRRPVIGDVRPQIMIPSTSTDEGFPICCEICGNSSIVNVSRPPGDSVCPVCGCFLWVTALAEMTRQTSFVPDLRIARLDATNRNDALREISMLIADELGWTIDQQTSFVDALLKREELGSTGIGRGFAVPHAKFDWINDFFAAMALAPDGIAFDALDGEPVHTIIVIASPQSRPGDHLRLLERVSRSLRWAGHSAA
jgi:mannitol/fructose-specific phosphotransferase system IIA component (Ntr-type)